MEEKEENEEKSGLKLIGTFKHLNAFFKKPEVDLEELIYYLAKLEIGNVFVHAPQSIQLENFLRSCFEVEEDKDGEIKLTKNKYKSFIWTLPKFNPHQLYNDSWVNECPRLSAFKFRVIEILIILLKENIPWKNAPVEKFVEENIKVSIYKVDNQTLDNPGYVWYVEINPKMAIKKTKIMKNVGKDLLEEDFIPLFSIIKTCFMTTYVNSLTIGTIFTNITEKFVQQMTNVEYLWDMHLLFSCTCEQPHWYKIDKHQFENVISRSTPQS